MAEPASAAELVVLLPTNRTRNLGPRIPAEVLARLGFDGRFAPIRDVIQVLADAIPDDTYVLPPILPATSRESTRLLEAVTKASQEGRFK